jgi:hypothetical protein
MPLARGPPLKGGRVRASEGALVLALVWLVVVVQGLDAEAGEEYRHQRTNAEGKDNSACANGSPHEPADDQDGELDADPGDSYVDASSREPCHQAISWARSQPGTDIESGTERDDDGAAEHQYPPYPHCVDGFGH